MSRLIQEAVMDESQKAPNTGIRLLKISAVYVCLASLVGLYMGITKDFVLTSVHAHIALLGWIGLAVAVWYIPSFPPVQSADWREFIFGARTLACRQSS
jgi:hypothetical protein